MHMNISVSSRIILLVVSLFCQFACSSKIGDPLQHKGASMIFGSGFASAPMETRFVILDNGQLYKENKSTETFSRLNKVDKNQIIQVFETYKMLNFEAIQLNEPGKNIYYFMEYHPKNAKKHRLVWGLGKKDQNVKLLDQILRKIIKDSKEG